MLVANAALEAGASRDYFSFVIVLSKKFVPPARNLPSECALLVFVIASKLPCQCPTHDFVARTCRSKDFSALEITFLCLRTFVNCGVT